MTEALAISAVSPPVASPLYTWEPSSEQIAARYGLRPDQVLRFDTNTSPDEPDFVSEVLGGPFETPLNEYPDSAYRALTEAAAGYAGVATEEVVVGAGADEVLDLVAKAFLQPGDRAVLPIPTYAMYGVLTSQRGAQPLAVPRRSGADGFRLDVDRLVDGIARGPAVVWLCAPNNPTGAPEAREVLEQVLEVAGSLPGSAPLVVVDEAYHEFGGETLVSLRQRYPHLLCVRTVSKAFGLAGIRVGFGIAARPTIERLERVRPPGSISTVSAALATAALSRPELARTRVATLTTERDRLATRLMEAGWQAWPSVTNFLLVSVGGHAAAEAVADRLLRAGIVPRTFGPANPLRGHLRLTVRSAAENDRLLEVLGVARSEVES